MASVSILGTGNFGQAMALRLVEHGYSVTCGSRHPRNRCLADRNPKLAPVTVTTMETAIKTANIVILALHADHHSLLAEFAGLLDGKIVVDVSNSSQFLKQQSLAERLATYIPKARIVKAFNTVSAYSLEHEESGESNVLPVCGSDLQAKEEVCQLAQTLGFRPCDTGALHKAQEQENKVLALFPGWWIPLFLSIGIWIFWFIYAMIHHFVYLTYRAYTPERIPVNISNKAFACTGLVLLSLAFLPGPIAGLVQLYRGSKHRPLNWFLAAWLNIRKQLGIYAFFCILFHLIFSLVILDPSYMRSWYLSYSNTIPMLPTADTRVPIGSRLNAIGETCVLLGALAAVLMLLLAITSVPAVGALLNWKEWNFVHSKLGLLCVLLATCHVNVMGFNSWINEDTALVIQEMTFLVTLFPWTVLLLRVILLMPCVKKPLGRIRQGWERNHPADPEANHRVQAQSFDNPNY